MSSFNWRLGKASLHNRQGVCSELIEINTLALTICTIDFGIPQDGGLRTARRQKELFDSGKSKCDGKTNLSYHQTGEALDFYAYVNGKASWHHPHLAMIALAHMKAASTLMLEIEWGGFWMNEIN